MTFAPALLQEIKDRLSIVGLIGEVVPLRKAGRDHKGLCPFHQEKSPSFMVSEEKQLFYCFGCGEGGDLIRFVMKREGRTFPEAVEQLAERAGVELPRSEDPAQARAAAAEAERLQRVYALNTAAAAFFHAQLKADTTGRTARKYLISRGFRDPAFLTQHFIGAADDHWDGLVQHLQERKMDLTLATDVGLIRPRPKREGHYDFFRQRLIFPIRDPKGRIVGFGGRALPGSGDESVKYLNSSDSAVFHKSRTLYGFPAAADAMRAADQAIVVEGYFDVLRLHQAGLAQTVAPLGTALTIDHLRRLQRYTTNLFFAFDGDEAGRQAARRSLPPALELQLIPRVVMLPAGEDPDSLVATQGALAFTTLLAAAPTLFEWVIDDTIASAEPGTAGRVRVITQLRPLFAKLRNPIEEATYQQRVAAALQLPLETIQRGLREGLSTKDLGAPPAAEPAPTHDRPTTPIMPTSRPSDRGQAAERECLRILLLYPRAMPQMARLLQPDEFRDPLLRAIAEQCWAIYEQDGDLQLARLVARNDDPELQRAISELAFSDRTYEDAADFSVIAQDIVRAMRKAVSQAELQRLTAAVAHAEATEAAHEVIALLTQKDQLLKQRAPS